MREDLLNELEAEYAARRNRNEQEEAARRDRIRREYPAIAQMTEERENLIFESIHRMLDGNGQAENLEERMGALNAKIGAALQAGGLPEDYLEPVYGCAKCKDTGYTGDLIKEPCECLQKAYQAKLREQIGLGKNGDETFETFNAAIIPETQVQPGITQRQLSELAKKQCEEWANRWPKADTRDLLLSGKSGLGKTFLMHSMAARLLERGVNVLMMSAYTFLQMARKSHMEAENGVQELTDVPVLMLDDLGSEPLMQNITVEQLFQLINERQIRGLSTVISTNLTLKELRERYTERIASRLNDPKNCRILLLEGSDLRKTGR